MSHDKKRYRRMMAGFLKREGQGMPDTDKGSAVTFGPYDRKSEPESTYGSDYRKPESEDTFGHDVQKTKSGDTFGYDVQRSDIDGSSVYKGQRLEQKSIPVHGDQKTEAHDGSGYSLQKSEAENTSGHEVRKPEQPGYYGHDERRFYTESRSGDVYRNTAGEDMQKTSEVVSENPSQHRKQQSNSYTRRFIHDGGDAFNSGTEENIHSQNHQADEGTNVSDGRATGDFSEAQRSEIYENPDGSQDFLSRAEKKPVHISHDSEENVAETGSSGDGRHLADGRNSSFGKSNDLNRTGGEWGFGSDTGSWNEWNGKNSLKTENAEKSKKTGRKMSEQLLRKNSGESSVGVSENDIFGNEINNVSGHNDQAVGTDRTSGHDVQKPQADSPLGHNVQKVKTDSDTGYPDRNSLKNVREGTAGSSLNSKSASASGISAKHDTHQRQKHIYEKERIRKAFRSASGAAVSAAGAGLNLVRKGAGEDDGDSTGSDVVNSLKNSSGKAFGYAEDKVKSTAVKTAQRRNFNAEIRAERKTEREARLRSAENAARLPDRNNMKRSAGVSEYRVRVNAENKPARSAEREAGKAAERKAVRKAQLKAARTAEKETEAAGRFTFRTEREIRKAAENSAGTAEKTAKSAGKQAHRLQKMLIKKQYQKAISAAKRGEKTAKTAVKGTEKVAKTGSEAVKAAVVFVAAHMKGIVIIAILILLFLGLCFGIVSCASGLGQAVSTAAAIAYQSDPFDIDAADLYFGGLEEKLRETIIETPQNHPGYDEYSYQTDTIGHDPFMLVSYLSADNTVFTYDDVKGDLDDLFEDMYELSYDDKKEKRFRTVIKTRTVTVVRVVVKTRMVEKTRTVTKTRVVTDKNGKKHTETYEEEETYLEEEQYEEEEEVEEEEQYEETEEYEVKVLKVKMTRTDMASLIADELDDEEMEAYRMYMETKGALQFCSTPFHYNWYGNINGYYGYRYENDTESCEIHRGLDIAAPYLEPIYAVLDGTVACLGYSDYYGHYIVIENEKGFETKYAHVLSSSFMEGDTVMKGEYIGQAGSSGIGAVNSQLHIELLFEGRYLNPLFYLNSWGVEIK